MASITKRLPGRNTTNKRLLVFLIRNSTNWRLDYSSGIRMATYCWTERLYVKQDDTNQGMNRILKRIGKLAGLDESVIIRGNKKGISYKRTLPKFDLISSHTARRSFATNAYQAGIPSISIMRITGHRTEKAFMQFIKVSQKENAIQPAGHSFFT